jgi:hypothetical protein
VHERGEIRLRTVLEMLLVAVIAYSAFQVWPAVKLRIDFLNEMETAANAPVEKSGSEIKYDLLKKAEVLGLTLFSDNLHVVRDRDVRKTVITAQYQIHINFWPRFTYVWHVKDQVEGYYL